MAKTSFDANEKMHAITNRSIPIEETQIEHPSTGIFNSLKRWLWDLGAEKLESKMVASD